VKYFHRACVTEMWEILEYAILSTEYAILGTEYARISDLEYVQVVYSMGVLITGLYM